MKTAAFTIAVASVLGTTQAWAAESLDSLLQAEAVLGHGMAELDAAELLAELVQRLKNARTSAEKLSLMHQMDDVAAFVHSAGVFKQAQAAVRQAIYGNDEQIKAEAVKTYVRLGPPADAVEVLQSVHRAKLIDADAFYSNLVRVFANASKADKLRILEWVQSAGNRAGNERLLELLAQPRPYEAMDAEVLARVRDYLERWNYEFTQADPLLNALRVRSLQNWLSAWGCLQQASNGTARDDAMVNVVLQADREPRLLPAWVLSSAFKVRMRSGKVAAPDKVLYLGRLQALEKQYPTDTYVRAAQLVLSEVVSPRATPVDKR